MIKEINEGLILLKAEKRKKQKWENQWKDYDSELAELERKIYNLENILSSEQKDVDRLEGFSVTKFFLTLRGAVDERLDKEKREVAAVQLKLEEARVSKLEILDSMNELHKKIQELGNVESDYQKLFSAKEKYIKESGSTSSQQLDELMEKEGDLKSHIMEVEEAVTAGDRVNQALLSAVTSLEKAEGWGTFDMFGGGMLSTMVKHDHMDEATKYAHEAQSYMRSFQKELLDVNEEADLKVDMSGLLRFTDLFFDGLIVDWMVQGRIQDSLDKTRQQQYQIHDILSKLKGQAGEKRKELAEVVTERKNLIESI
ncbi:hypothetical protein [Sutcliffiella deserti]|uniref:hypothetical protein n=1 Tax=Sutcliffiella deserti TaxID=2875501 RepID=UPI001CBCE398|nr:hypothetical protein [Sutcliffiella deserti]